MPTGGKGGGLFLAAVMIVCFSNIQKPTVTK